MKRSLFCVLLVVLIASCAFAAASNDMTAKEILDRMDELMDFDSCIMSATMVNTDRLGSTSMVFTTYQKGDGDTLLVVTQGPDKGQKILRLDSDIYIYYPDADEVIRLSSSGLKNSFLGSDFSYEDLTGDDDYDSRYESSLEDNVAVDGVECYAILMKARKSSETYQMERVYVDVSTFLPVKFEMYSKSGKLLKSMYYSNYIEDKGSFFPGSIKVVNAVKKNSYSDITIDSLSFGEDLDPSMFDKEELAW